MLSNDPKEILYFVQPGDTLTKIANLRVGFGPRPRIQDRIQELQQLNPHIKNPNFIMAGEPIRLVRPEGIPHDVSETSLREVRNVWLSARPEEREIIQSNFDVLEWLALSKHVGESLNTMGEETEKMVESVAEFRLTGAIPGEVLKVSTLYKELLSVRTGTIAFIRQMQISVVRQPIIILRYTRNGLYNLSRRLLRVVEIAEKINLSRKLLFLEMGIETIKVGQTAVRTRSAVESAKQAGRGGSAVLTGLAATKIGKQMCRLSLRMNNKIAGAIICGVSLAATTFGGVKLGQQMGKLVFGPPIETELPQLP